MGKLEHKVSTILLENTASNLKKTQYCRFHSNDLDFTRQKVGEVYCDHKLTVRKGLLNAFHYHIPFQDISINLMSYGSESIIEPGYLKDFYLIQMPLSGRAFIQADSHNVESMAGKASILNPDIYTKMTWSKGCEQLLIQVSKRFLNSVMHQCIGSSTNQSVVFNPTMDINNQLCLAWWRQLTHFLDEYIKKNSFYINDMMIQSEVKNLIRGLLYSAEHNYSKTIHHDDRSPLPKHIKTAVAYIQENFAQHICIDDLVSITQASERSIYQGFKNHLQVTPKQYIQQIRLKNTREQIIQQASQLNPSLSITDIALNNGFTQLGRFSAYYKDVFGELPTQTMKRIRDTN